MLENHFQEHLALELDFYLLIRTFLDSVDCHAFSDIDVLFSQHHAPCLIAFLVSMLDRD